MVFPSGLPLNPPRFRPKDPNRFLFIDGWQVDEELLSNKSVFSLQAGCGFS